MQTRGCTLRLSRTDFARQTLETTFAVGDIVQAERLRVRIHADERAATVAGDHYVKVKPSTNAGGSPPELDT
ncbi:MAG: hypothetical protein JNN03_11130 [Rubrivivax sp.]|nr:hypothetical protein [Rubrivivax sp.]